MHGRFLVDRVQPQKTIAHYVFLGALQFGHCVVVCGHESAAVLTGNHHNLFNNHFGRAR